MFDRRLVQNFDWVLLGLVLIICATGIVNLYSAGYNRGEGTPLYVKQLYWLAVGLGVMCVTLTYDYRYLEKLSYPIYIISILLLVAVMFGGKMVAGSRRWLPLGPFAFQPAELAKIAIILALATYFNRRARTGSHASQGPDRPRGPGADPGGVDHQAARPGVGDPGGPGGRQHDSLCGGAVADSHWVAA